MALVAESIIILLSKIRGKKPRSGFNIFYAIKSLSIHRRYYIMLWLKYLHYIKAKIQHSKT